MSQKWLLKIQMAHFWARFPCCSSLKQYASSQLHETKQLLLTLLQQFKLSTKIQIIWDCDKKLIVSSFETCRTVSLQKRIAVNYSRKVVLVMNSWA